MKLETLRERGSSLEKTAGSGSSRIADREPTPGVAALRYAEMGYSVFPCKPLAKQPATANGLLDATRERRQLEDWWLTTPRANVAILPPEGALVLDFDTAEALETWQERYPELRAAPLARTPRGGGHLYLRLPEGATPPKTATKIGGEAVDVRGLGKAYLLGAPSIVTGRAKGSEGRYHWERALVPPDALPVASEGLLEALTPKRPEPPQPMASPIARADADHARRYALAALQGEHDTVAAAKEGERNHALNKAAFALGQLVGAGALEMNEATDALLAAAETCKLPHGEAKKTVRSGLEAGVREPRAIPKGTPTGSPSGEQSAAPVPKPRASLPTKISAAELMTLEMQPARHIVKGFLPAGLSVLGARPKIGKSWLALSVAVVVASKGKVLGEDVEQGDALYCGLEDGLRRLQERLKKLLGPSAPPERLELWTTTPRLHEGGLDELRGWADAHPDARLIVVDTWARAAPPHNGKGDAYDHLTTWLGALQALALEREIAVLLVHHTKKPSLNGGDIFDQLLGSSAFGGVPDALLVMQRERMQADAVLAVTGRDVDERQVGLSFDEQTGLWSVVGDADRLRVPPAESQVLKAIEAGYDTPTKIAEHLEKGRTNVQNVLTRLLSKGLIGAGVGGTYHLKEMERERK